MATVSILRRPLDLIIVLIFINFFIIGITIDYTQAVYGSVLAQEDIDYGLWPPVPVLKVYAWWCETVDPLLGRNPSWYATMATVSPILYCPFYLIAIYAFIKGKEWIRIPALLWGWGLLHCMIIVVHEQLYGPYPTKNVMLFAVAYGAYIIMPLVVMVRVAKIPLFEQTQSRGSGGSGQKKRNKKD